uniref:Uncharacterized protein n=1 Tax=Fagus sylvatica TaxID=28930 RepID=A0A2N9EHJ8_FAGSY
MERRSQPGVERRSWWIEEGGMVWPVGHWKREARCGLAMIFGGLRREARCGLWVTGREK